MSLLYGYIPQTISFLAKLLDSFPLTKLSALKLYDRNLIETFRLQLRENVKKNVVLYVL